MIVTELGRLASLVRSVRRRVRAVWALETVQALAPIVAVTALVLVAAGWLLPAEWTGWTAWMEWAALAVTAATLVTIGVVASTVRLPDLTVARVADRGLSTRDAFATALEFADVEPFGPRIRARAIALAEPALNLGIIPSRLLIALHNGERVILDVGPFPFGRRRSWVRAIDLAKDQAKS